MNPRLRALGRLLLFVVLATGLLSAKKLALRRALHGTDSTVLYLVDHFIDLAVLLVFGSVMARVERRPFGAFGMPWRRALRAEFWQGAAAGIGALTVVIFALRATGAIQLSMSSTPALQGAALSVAYAVVFLLLAMREEFGFRGYGLFTLTELTELTGFWPAALATSVWFAWAHTGSANENWLGIVNVGIFGVMACVMLRRTGSLWMPIGFHAAWNWGQTYFFGVGDSGHPPAPGHFLTSTVASEAPAWLSGASVGPEGSALCTVLVAILILVYTRVLSGVRYPEVAPDNAMQVTADDAEPAR